MSYAILRHLRRTVSKTPQYRYETTVTNLTQEDYLYRPPMTQWNKILKEAEKVVGYPTSFMNLRFLLSDEFANMAMHLRKVVGSNHPILETAKNLVYNEQNNLQPWGLVILLLSKSLSTTNSLNDNSVAEQQRILAELTEMIRTGHYVHKGLLNIPIEERDKNTESSIFANKIAILIGDYLLVTANGMLAKLKNQDLSYLISTALRDLSEGEFYGERDHQNMPIPGKPIVKSVDKFDITSDTLPLDVIDALGSPVKEWTLRTMYNGGSLFGRGCQGAALLGNQNLDVQHNAFMFGCHICLAWQAASELQKFTSHRKETYSLVSAPVLFALHNNPDLFTVIEKGKTNITDIDFEDFKIDILKTDSLEQTRLLYVNNCNKAISYIETFGDSQPVHTLKSMVKAI